MFLQVHKIDSPQQNETRTTHLGSVLLYFRLDEGLIQADILFDVGEEIYGEGVFRIEGVSIHDGDCVCGFMVCRIFQKDIPVRRNVQ